LFWSLCYLVFRCVLQLVARRPRSEDFKELEIVVLRHELSVLRRQTRRPQLTTTDRVFLAAASQLLPWSSWRSFLVTPATLLRRLVARRWTYGGRSGRSVGARIPVRSSSGQTAAAGPTGVRCLSPSGSGRRRRRARW
jgi:putative transposase